MPLRSIDQEYMGQTPWRSGTFLADVVPRKRRIFLSALPSYDPLTFLLSPYKKHLHTRKLATSSIEETVEL
jgi:hypothetical protein